MLIAVIEVIYYAKLVFNNKMALTKNMSHETIDYAEKVRLGCVIFNCCCICRKNTQSNCIFFTFTPIPYWKEKNDFEL